MSNQQLEHDLYKQIRAKYRRWIEDSIDLYQMAGLPEAEAFVAITNVVITSLVNVMTQLDVPPEKVAQEIYNNLREAQQEKRERRASQNKG